MDASVFDFVTPKPLRDNILESVEFATQLWALIQDVEEKYRDEMIRTVILYNISIVEALLLFWVKKQKVEFLEDKYSHKHVLPPALQTAHEEGVLIVALHTSAPKPETRIWLHDLLLNRKSFLGASLYSAITELQDIRNTFHLSKKRQSLTLSKAEKSFDVVLRVVKKIQADLA